MQFHGNEIIDLSHVIANGTQTYKGLPAPLICDYWTREYSSQFYEEDTSFQIARIDMVTNTGTYIDSPFHRYENGEDLAGLTLARLVDLEGILVMHNLNDGPAIGPGIFGNSDLNGKAILVQTGWDQYWETGKYSNGHPFLTKESAIFLSEKTPALVGIDSYNIDNTTGKTRPVHSILLKNGILIVEHMCNLNRLSGKKFKFSAVPPKIKGAGSFPVRAYAIIQHG